MKRRRPVPSFLWEKVADTYLRTRSFRATAAELGLTKSGVEYILQQLDVPRFPRVRSGEENPAWKGGRAVHVRARERLWKVFTYPVLQRDGFRCVKCNTRSKLHVHHERRRFAGIVDLVRARLPEATDDQLVEAIVAEHALEDGETLCSSCHLERHTS